MLDQIISFLHVAPLVLVGFMFLISKLNKLSSEASLYRSLLVLSSIGIISGAFVHGHMHSLLDPCFGYAATLLYVAFKITGLKSTKASIAE